MRFVIILAFVSSVFFAADPVEARPGPDAVAQARKPPKAHKRRAARSVTKAKPKSSKRSRKAAKAKAEEVEVAEAEAPAAEPEVEAAPPVKRAPVAQATDDEVPPNEPKKKR